MADINPMASSTTGFTNLMPILYDTRFLERAKIMLCYDYGADRKNMPLNSGKTVYFNRFSPLAVQTTPLTECVTPTALDMTSTINLLTVVVKSFLNTWNTLFSYDNYAIV